ncbi:hypothetical protein [uncultured Bradyrhizobium sp.]|jgi:hypothetical protein|uniref:hypothetical protein n=1 Tax=uncultured Bradyrhizobium sp. TaxID=199684 RepID=UPI0026102F6D|nr:hypothetical protein [uncultured Bradyrhizobium sp.]
MIFIAPPLMIAKNIMSQVASAAHHKTASMVSDIAFPRKSLLQINGQRKVKQVRKLIQSPGAGQRAAT